jgi:hypothetical protein
MTAVIKVIWQLAIAAQLVLAVRLAQQRLVGVYQALFGQSCLFAAQNVLLMLSISDNRSTMRATWQVTEPIVWLCWVWLVLDLFSKWSRSYKGIGRFGRYLFVALVSAAFLVSLIGWPYEWRALVTTGDNRVYLIFNRILFATLALFTVSVWVFFHNYPTPVTKNLVRHTYITIAYLCSLAFGNWAFTLSGTRLTLFVNVSIVLSAALCFGAWAVLLTRKGEARESIPYMDPNEIEKIVRLNRELLILMRELPEEIGAQL